MTDQELTIRPATAADVPTLMQLIRALAEFEGGLDQLETNEAILLRDGFQSDPPRFKALVAEQAGRPVGMALCCFHYSTWRGHRLYLEDLMVLPEARGQGVGGRLLEAVRQLALAEGCTGVMWQVLDWNTNAIRFYERLGVSFDAEWINCHWHAKTW